MGGLQTVPNIYVDNCRKSRDNTCKKGRGQQCPIPALTRFTSREYTTPLMKHSLPTSRARLIAASFKSQEALALRANVIGKGEVSVCFPAAVLQLLYWDSRSLHSAGDRSVCMKATFLRLGNWSPYGTLVAACSGQRIANSELLTMGNPTV
jgi:hypothetical protein